MILWPVPKSSHITAYKACPLGLPAVLKEASSYMSHGQNSCTKIVGMI